MKLSEYFENTKNVTVASFANKIGVSRNVIYQWINNIRPVPVQRCRSVVIETGGAVIFSDLRPHDWHLIWDEPIPASIINMTQNKLKNKHIPALDEACKIMGTQAALAKALGINTTNISQWRKSGSVVPAHHCLEIEKLTGVQSELLNPSVNWEYIRGKKHD